MKKSLFVIAAAIGLIVIASVAIWKTSGDDSRRQGALGTDEPVSLSWYGDWNAEAAYAPGSVVTYEGASYVAEGEKLSTPTADCSDCGWTPLAIEGASEELPKEEAPTEEAVGALSGYEIVKDDLVIPAGSSTGTKVVNCPAGKKVFGGGSLNVWVDYDGPVGPDANGLYGWKFHATLQGGGATLYVYAVCANAS